MVDSAVFDEDELNNNVPQRRETFDYIRNNRFNALLDNMKSVKYLAPKWQNLTFKSTTDDSGNKIISQKMNYKAIDEFNEDDVMNDNVFDLSNSQKQKIFNLNIRTQNIINYFLMLTIQSSCLIALAS